MCVLLMFANDGGGAIPTAASSSAQFLLDTALPAPPPVSCPGTCGWWPPSTSALPGTLATTTTAQQWQQQQQQLELLGGGDDEATMVELIFAHCKPCPWGTRRLPSSAFSSPAEVPSPSLPSSLCHPCEVPLPTIDYLFLLFHALLPFVVNHVAICHHSARRLRHSPRLLPLTLCQLGCALIECSLAFVGSLLLFRPFGHLRTFGCPRDGKLAEWYSLFNNPVLQYTRVLHCASELVFPLYSLPFAIYALNLFTLLILRALLHCIVSAFSRRTVLPNGPFYAALWALPLLALAHAVLSGVLHALFPFIALLVSLVHLVVHLSAAASANSATTVAKMFRLLFMVNTNSTSRDHRGHSSSVDGFRHGQLPIWLPLLVHVALFGYALFTLCIVFGAPNTGQSDEFIGKYFGGSWPPFLLILCGLLPVPTLFFILTIRLTTPGGICAAALANRRLSSE
ncbi:hypothetical protein niasHT_006086 [Heterodera trifolii]|uniref:Uncharacterized protein n=1 Tax=Heterodera trifolii TaxID=157864 RepID=A0ABD2LY02_9BILA